jgi:catalase (peroxidase I)
MGFNDREIVALCGAHSLGRCHPNRSGYSGPWTRSPVTFSNEYFRFLLDETWTEKKWNGPKQYENAQKDLMMLPVRLPAQVPILLFKREITFLSVELHVLRCYLLILLRPQADLALIQDPEFKKYVQLYKNDNAAFQKVRCAVTHIVLILIL